MYQHFFNKRTLVIVIVVLALTSLAYATAGDRVRITGLEAVTREVVAPVQVAFTAVANWASGLWEFVRDLFGGRRELVALRHEVDELRIQLDILKEREYENQRLRHLLELKQQSDHDLVAAAVIGRDPGNWMSVIVVNKGSASKIARNMAVLAPGGLVGRVISVSPHTATVMLITDPRSVVSGLVQETRAAVIVEGLVDKSGLLKLTPLESSAQMNVGDTVISSGLGGVFPKGIKLGKIERIEDGAYGVTKVAYVRPDVDLSSLEEVLIVRDSRPFDGGAFGGLIVPGDAAFGRPVGGRGGNMTSAMPGREGRAFQAPGGAMQQDGSALQGGMSGGNRL